MVNGQWLKTVIDHRPFVVWGWQPMDFVKMHGLGNDFVMLNCLDQQIPEESLPGLAVKLCDRHFGVGADGVELILPSEKADYRMRILNSDGSEAEMCGNGIRCFAKYLHDYGLTDKDTLGIETLAGIQVVEVRKNGGSVESVRVDMGVPRTRPEDIPIALPNMSFQPIERVVNETLDVNGQIFSMTCVSMGNPHCVIFLEEVDHFPFQTVGPQIENHPVFPARTNVHFTQILSPTEVKVKVWERGAGPTLACGTGACATLVAGVMTDLLERRAVVQLPGGALLVEWADSGHVYMTGPAATAFAGEVGFGF
jgi:diaminopimelate epimerase